MNSHEPVEYRLWPGKAPLSIGDTKEDNPSIIVTRPEIGGTGACILICPGGGYAARVDHEKYNVAAWVTSLGMTAAILNYRIAPRYRHPAPLTDACRAIRYLRANASDLQIDPKRIGVIGFSAGGHLAGHVSNESIQSGDDEIEKQSSRPDAAILAYPVISFYDQHGHTGSRENLLGPHHDPKLTDELSLQNRVTKNTPPTFLFHGQNDGIVPVIHSLLYAETMSKAKAPFELLIYERAQHGVNIGAGDPLISSWTDRCRDWLSLREFCKR